LPFTRDYERARGVFASISLPGRRTAIFDAALTAARSFQNARTRTNERRIIIIISDGLDTASAVRPVDAVNEALLRDATFYVIHTPLFAPREGRLRPRPASKGFRELAEKTGGQFFVVGDVETALSPRPVYDLRPVFQAIEDDLRGQYLLAYHAAANHPTTKPRRVEVRLKPQPGRKLRIRQTRQEYFIKGGRSGSGASALP
jgi:uncharacterized protein (DUF1501 family)